MSWLKNHILSLSNRQLLTDIAGHYNYGNLHQQVDAYITYLNTFLKDGEIVAILGDYSFYSIALFLALLEKKSIIVPIVSEKQLEVNKRIDIAGCTQILSIDDHGSLKVTQKGSNLSIHPLISGLIQSSRSGLILFSSGSTGEPKAMIHDLDTLVESYQGKKLKSISILVFLMFDHIGGLNTLLSALSIGSLIVLPENRSPNHIASLIQKSRVHVLPTSPTFLNLMLMEKVNEKYDLSSLRIITYGTETMPNSLLQKLKKVFSKARLIQTFGTSETGIIQTQSRSSESLEIKLDDEYKVVDGELWLRSKTQIIGYLNASMSSFTDDGWFQTGDLVEKKENGYIQIIGRHKEIINVGGLKVLPIEVESTLLELDIVADCMVYAEENVIIGQIVVADIVLSDSISPKDAKAMIKTFCQNRLDKYKIPVKIHFLEKTNFNERFKKLRLIRNV